MPPRPSVVIRSSELRAQRGKTRISGRGEKDDVQARLAKVETYAFRNLRGDRAALENLADVEETLTDWASVIQIIGDTVFITGGLATTELCELQDLQVNDPAHFVGAVTMASDLTVTGELVTGLGNGGFILSTGLISAKVSGDRALDVGRDTNDGTIVNLRQAGTVEGTISVSGTTVSFNGGHLSRFSQWGTGYIPPSPLYRGTVLSNLDEKAEWIAERWIEYRDADRIETVKARAVSGAQRHELYQGDLKPGQRYRDSEGLEHIIVREDNEQLNRVKVSEVDADPDFAGIFDVIDEDGDIVVAGRGEFLVRVGKNVAVSRGDMLVSAGDGTARPVSDAEPITLKLLKAIIGKVLTSEKTITYPDGSYLVPVML